MSEFLMQDEELNVEDELGLFGLALPEMDAEDKELDDEDFVDLAPLYVQDVANVGEVRV